MQSEQTSGRLGFDNRSFDGVEMSPVRSTLFVNETRDLSTLPYERVQVLYSLASQQPYSYVTGTSYIPLVNVVLL